MSQSRKQQQQENYAATTTMDSEHKLGYWNYYKNRQSMQSPKQMTEGIPPRNSKPTDIRLKPDIRQMPLSQSSIGGNAYRSRSSNVTRPQEKHSQKSALTEFADQRSSARQHQMAPGLTTESNQTGQIMADCAGSTTSGGFAKSGKFENRLPSKTEASYSDLRQSRSSSALIAGTPTVSQKAPAPFNSRVMDSRNNIVQSYIHTTQEDHSGERQLRDGASNHVTSAVQDFQATTQSSGYRTMKECKKELGEDREAKALRRRHRKEKKDKKHKKSHNSRRQPEFVVVYRYPPAGTTGNSSSEVSQTQTQTSQYLYTSNPDLAQSSSAQTSLVSKDHPGYYIPGVPPHPNERHNVQILSMTSGFGHELSNPISPSDLLVPLPNNFEKRSSSRRGRRATNGKELLDSQMVSHNKHDGARSSNQGSMRSRSDKSHSQSRSKSQKRRRESKGRQGGIKLYEPEQQLLSSKRQNVPLTSSQLEDSYIDRPAPSQNQQRQNKPFLYYQKLKSVGGNSHQFPMSHRPQEVILSGDHQEMLLEQRKHSHNTANSLVYRDQYSSTHQPNQPQLSRSSSQKSSKLNLAEYKTLISIQEQAFEQKLLQVKDQISSDSKSKITNYHKTRQGQSRSTSLDHVSMQKKQSRSRLRELHHPVQNMVPSMRQSELQPIPDHEESQEKESLSPQLRRGNEQQQMSLTGQSYLSYLNRVTKNDSARVSVRPTPRSEPEAGPQRKSPIRHKSVDNAKRYAIYKITGQLDTKRELEQLPTTSACRGFATKQVQMRYQEAQEKMRRTLPTHFPRQEEEANNPLPRDESKSSFIKRFEKHTRREADRSKPSTTDELQYDYRLKDQRSHSHIDLSNRGTGQDIGFDGNNSSSYLQADSTFQGRGGLQSYPVTNVVSMQVSQEYNNQVGGAPEISRNAAHQQHHQSTYYTLAGPAEQLSAEHHNYSYQQQRSQQQHQRTSPLRNSSTLTQTDFNGKMLQVENMDALMQRVDSALTKSREQLSYTDNTAENQSIYLHNETVQEDSQESLQSEPIKHHQPHQESSEESLLQKRLIANQMYEHRLSELKRQSDQVQRLPDFYQDRVSELKQRTTDITELAKNYTSEKDSINYTGGLVTTQNQSPEKQPELTSQQQHPMFLNNNDYYPQGDQEQVGPQVDASGSFVKQHDVTSSFLQEQQQFQQFQQFKHQRPDAAVGQNHQDLYKITERVSGEAEMEQHQEMLPNAEDYLMHENEATRNQAVERENIKNDQLFGADKRRISRPQVLSQQITMTIDNDDYNDFELTKKLGVQPFSQATYRDDTCGNVDTRQSITVQQTEGDANVIDKDRLARKERRRDKREKKLQKLKQLHDLAQSSMGKIASGLTSRGGNKRTASQDNLQSSRLSVDPRAMLSEQQSTAEIGSAFDEKRESVRSQVEKLTGVRKEIKKLIKIQNQHGQLLHKLQSKGVIKDTHDSQTSQGFKSESEMTEHQKQYQVAMSTSMLTQMQEIFSVMAKIQKKLDFEIEERQKRQGQVKDDKVIDMVASDEYRSGYFDRRDSSFGGNNRGAQHQPMFVNQQPPTQSQHLQQQQEQPPQVGRNHKSSAKNNVSHGTNSTLFWETQNAQNNSTIFHGQHPSFNKNAGFLANGAGGYNEVVQAYESNGSIVINPSSTDVAIARTTQSEDVQEGSNQKDDNKGEFFYVKDVLSQQVEQHPLQQMMPQTNPTEVDEQDDDYKIGGYALQQPRIMEPQLNVANNTLNSAMSSSQMTLQGIRVDQLCEILSREINRVREDSVVQANEMRAQYEEELQAIRNEFYGAKFAGDTQNSHQTQGECDKTLSQLKNHMSNMDQHSQSRTPKHQQDPEIQDPTFHQLAQFPPIEYPSQPSNVTEMENEASVAANANQAARTHTEMNVFSQQMFDELQKVKAERDLYYEKLLKVRQRIEKGKSQLPKVNEMVSQRTSDVVSAAGISEIGLDHQESVSQRTPNETMREKSINPGFTQAEFNCLEDQRNVRSVNQIVKGNHNQFDHQWPSQEAQSNNNGPIEVNTFKHDFSDHVLKQNPTILQSLESDPSSFNAAVRFGGGMTNPTSSQQTKMAKQAGKIVHQIRSFEASDLTTKTRQVYGEVAKGTNQYINVRHNKTSMLRQQSKALVKKCQKCLMDTFEDCNASFRSDVRSNKSGTRGTISNAMSSLNNDRCSSQERNTICQCNKPPRTKKAGPYINNNNNHPGVLDSSAISNSSRNNGPGQRGASTPQEIMTFSARGNSTFNSQIEKQHSEAPSKSIGGNQSIQSMIARSPNLISRLAAEHEQYLQQVAAQESFDNSQMQQQQTGGGAVSDHSTFDNHKTSQALTVINHYLEKYEKR